jgi:cobalt/nickel transport system permease protein
MIKNHKDKDEDIRWSLLHSLDPRVKIITFFFLIFVILFTPSSSHFKFLVYSLGVVFMIALSHIRIRDISRRFLLLFTLLLFLAASLFLFGKKPFTEEIAILWNLFIKSWLIFFCLAVLNLTTEFHDIIKSFEQLKVPRLITSLFSFAYRYSTLFFEEAERTRKAVVSRSFGRGGRMDKIKVMKHVLPHIFFKSLERSERIYAAMLSRGYVGKIQTFSFYRLKRIDFLYLFFFLSLLALTLGVL